ncbi:hypothetical protein MSPP1_001230 [Malassezia sp. CBS 17886]|nr:hypothetical protein MSPP1_001230 [Malassezia sp. CBS 17886]
MADDAAGSARAWLDALPAHPVFARAGDGASAGGAGTDGGGERTARLATRGTDLVVAAGCEVRLTGLAQAKRALQSGGGDGALSYKVLAHPLLNFPVRQVVVNPTGKLLAVVGTHAVVLVILPRRGYMKHIGTQLEVKALRLGAYYHGPGAPVVVQCRWHPLGRDGASLVVLTDDAILREYDVESDVDEPQQTVPVLSAEATARTRAAFSADDDEALCAASFAFGADGVSPSADDGAAPVDWLPLTVFAVMQNGDVWALCPFLPRHAVVTRALVDGIAAYEAGRVHVEGSSLARRYAADLLQQVAAAEERADSTLGAALNDGVSAPELGAAPASARYRIEAPRAIPYPLAPQGPFLLRPAPRDLSEDVAGTASDILITTVHSACGAARLSVAVIAARDGSVNVYLLLEPLIPLWSLRDERGASRTLVVYETIDLALTTLGRAPFAQLVEQNGMNLVSDPLYPDTVYVTHAFGVHAVCFADWTTPILAALDTDAPGAIRDALAQHVHSTATCIVHTACAGDAEPSPVAGIALLSDVYLSYSLLALTADAHLAAVELGLRLDGLPRAEGLPRTDGRPLPGATPPSPPAYTSLLADPFAAPPLAHPPDVRVPGGKLHVTPDSLRAFGAAAAQFRTGVRDVAQGANAAQMRIEQQQREAQRQLAQVSSIAARTDALPSSERMRATLDRLTRTQAAQLQRLDALLQRLMDEHQPELSAHERRWFDELQRIAAEFGLEHQLDVLRPSLAEYVAQKQANAAHQRLGTHQARRIESMLSHECVAGGAALTARATLLAQARAKVLGLQKALAGANAG